MNLDFTEGVWNRFKSEVANLKAISSNVEQRAFVRDAASREGVVVVKAADVENDWDFERMVSANGLVACGIRESLKEIQRACEDVCKAVPTFVLDVIDLSRKVVETIRNNANLLGHNEDLMMELVGSRTSDCLA